MTIKMQTGTLTEALKKTGASAAKKDDQMYKNFLTPKETPEGMYYRLRLLYYIDDNNTRTTPFVEQYSHVVYNNDETGKLSIEFATCPTSPYLNIKNAWAACPICQYADKQYNMAKDTNWKNKTASAAHRKMRRQFVCFIPVFVVNDPNSPDNNGRVMLLKIRDRNAYVRLCDQIKGKEHECVVFNGSKAVDLAIVVSRKPQLDKEGNERLDKEGKPYTFIDYKFQFSSKPYDVEIPMEQIEGLGFDDSIYSYSSEEELRTFLSKYTAPADIPDNDFDLNLTTDQPIQTPTPGSQNEPVKPANDISDFGDGITMGEETPAASVDVNDLVDIDFGSSPTEEQQTPPAPVDEAIKEEILGDKINVEEVLEGIPNLDDIFE